MTDEYCDDCGQRLPNPGRPCPNCDDLADRAETDPSDDLEGLETAADSMRRDQWTTYLVLTGGGLAISALLIGIILYQMFGTVDGYPNNRRGVEKYVDNFVLQKLEQRLARKTGADATCQRQETTGDASSGEYETRVRCRLPDETRRTTVEISHGGTSVDWYASFSDEDS